MNDYTHSLKLRIRSLRRQIKHNEEMNRILIDEIVEAEKLLNSLPK